MASINEIAVKMTADTEDAVQGFMKVDREIKRLMRIQKALGAAGMGGKKIDQEISSMISKLRELQGAFDKSKKKAKLFENVLAEGEIVKRKSIRTSEGLAQRMREFDADIKRAQADLAYLNRAGIQDVNNGLAREIKNLQAAKASMIAYSGASRMAAASNVQLSKDISRSAMSSGRWQVAMAQASFGVEDFMTQIGPMGLGGALRASGNNMSMVAHSLSGWKWGAAVGIGMAILPMLVNLLGKTEKATDKVAEKIKKLADSTVNLQELRKKTVLQAIEDPVDRKKHQRDLEDLENSKKTAEEMEKVRDDAIKSEREYKDELVEVEKERDRRVTDFQVDLVEQGMSMKDAIALGSAALSETGIEAEMDKVVAASGKAIEDNLAKITAKKRLLATLSATIGGGGEASVRATRDLMAEEDKTEELKKQHNRMIAIREEQAGSTSSIEAALQREKILRREITQAQETANASQAHADHRAGVEADLRIKKEERLAELKGQEEGIQQELKDLNKASQAVAGSFSSQENVGANMAEALADKFRSDKDIKREDLNDTLKQIRDEQKKVSKFKVVGAY